MLIMGSPIFCLFVIVLVVQKLMWCYSVCSLIISITQCILSHFIFDLYTIYQFMKVILHSLFHGHR